MSILRITAKRTAGVVFLTAGLLLLLANTAHTQEPDILTDLDGLEGVNADFVRAYDLVSTRQAWDSIRQELVEQGRAPQLVRVGIVDTGIDAQHEEFNDVRINSFTSRDLIDPRYKSTCRPPIKGHGTQVAGIIGAGNLVDNPAAYQEGQMNGILSGALAEDQYILESRSLLSDVGLENTPATYFDSRFWARNVVRAGSQVVNFSFSTTSKQHAPNNPCAVEQEEFRKATRAWIELFKRYQEIERFNRVVFVASAGNSGVNSLAAAPANAVVLDSVLFDGLELENVIVAGAVDLEGNRAIFSRNEDGTEKFGSNFGLGVHVAAPGKDVYTPTQVGLGDFPPDGPLAESYTTRFGGTSSAAPFVTGVVGLIKALEPNAGTDNALTPTQIQDILVSTGSQIDTDEPIGPLLNALATVCDFRVLNCDPPEPSVLTVDETTDNSVALSWTQNPDRDFMSYKLFRSDEPNVGIDDTLLAEITEKTTTTFIDTGLQQGQTFFYALLTFDEGGKSSLSNEVEATTGPPPAPERFLIKAGLSSGAPPGEEPPRILVADSADRLWTVYTNKDTSNDYQVFTSFSDDQGQIWTEEQVTSTTRSPSTNVSIATDSTGTVHILWAEHISGSRRGLFHASRTNSAADWTSTKETVFSTNKTINLGGLTVDKNDVLHAVWSVQQSTFTSNLFYSKRISAVSDWTDNLELVDSKPRLFFATAANSVVSDGNSGIHVAYAARGSASDPTKTHVFYTKRVGLSGDWADNREQITGLDAASGLGFDQFFRALLVTDDETPHLIFDGSGFGDFPNRPQVVAARRTLGTWTLMPLTNNFNGGAAPTITRSQDGTFRVFFGSAGTGTHTTKSQLFISDGNGITWSTPQALTDEPSDQTRPNALITPVPASGYGLVFSESVPGGFDLFFLDGGLVF